MNQQRRDLMAIEQELAARAAQIREQVGQPEARKISLDRSGNFVAAGGVNLGSEITICVVDFCSANDYYTAAYDPNTPRPPVCFARARKLADLAPEPEAPEPQAENCAICPHNQFGSRGEKAKACKNTRLLAVVLADELAHLAEGEKPEMHLMSVPPTALRSFDAYALQAARLFNGPPIKTLVTVRAVPKGNYTTLQFSAPEANPYYAEVFELADMAEELLGRLPDLTNYVPTRQSQQRVARPVPRR